MKTGIRSTMAMACAGLGLALLFGACSSSESRYDYNGSFADQQRAEFSYLSDEKVKSFRSELHQYVNAMAAEDALTVSTLASRLSQSALRYSAAIESGLYDSDSAERRQVSAALMGFSGQVAYAPRLIDVIAAPADDEAEEAVRVYASLGLVALGNALKEAPNDNQRAGIMSALGAMTVNTDESWQVRNNAVAAYGQSYNEAYGDSLRPLLDAVQNDPDPNVREMALIELGDARSELAVPEIAQAALGHPDVRTREAAAVALGRIPSQRALTALRSAMATEADLGVRRKLLVAVAGQRDVADAETLVNYVQPYLYDMEPELRVAAVIASEKIGDALAVEGLVQATRDESPRVRLAAVSALSTVTPKEDMYEKMIIPVVDTLNDGDTEVATRAYSFLRSYTGQNYTMDRETWLTNYFYTKHPDRDPVTANLGNPRPRLSSIYGTQTTQPNRNTGRNTRQTWNRNTRTNTNNRNTRTNTRNTRTQRR